MSKLGPSRMTVSSKDSAPSPLVTSTQSSPCDPCVSGFSIYPGIIEVPEIVVSQSTEFEAQLLASPDIASTDDVNHPLQSPAGSPDGASPSNSTERLIQLVPSPDISYTDSQANSQPMPLQPICTDVNIQEADINAKSCTSFRSDHSYVSPVFSKLCVPEPKVRKQRDTLWNKLPKALSGTEAIKLLREKKQKKEGEKIAKLRRKEERKLKKRLKVEETERRNQERELKKKEREALKKQKEKEKQQKKTKSKTKACFSI